MRKYFTSFVSLNLTQFFSIINDNLYKLLLIFLLISIRGEEQSNMILSLAGAIFVVPFILFASISGTVADRFSKRTIIYITRVFEIIIMIGGVLAFTYHSVIGGYSVLFLLATHSAFFSPAKYGIIPEIVPTEKISKCNGILSATTYLGIIVGTFLASLLTEATNKNFILAGSCCVLFALLGAASCLGIKKTVPQAAEKKVSARFISVIYNALKKARNIRYLLPTIIFGAYFLFMGAYTQLNIIPYVLQSLHLSEVYGGYLFLMTAVGIGLGSFLAGFFSSKQVELGFVPFAALGAALSFITLFLISGSILGAVIALIFLGIFGGFYIVPVEAFIQAASPNEDRGQNVATANFLNFIGVIIASGLLAFLGSYLKLSAALGFLVMSILTFVLAITLFILFADQVLRLILAKTARFFWDIRATGRKKFVTDPPTLYVGRRTSWIDTLIVMTAIPRMIRYIVPIRRKITGRPLLYSLLSLVPVDKRAFTLSGDKILRTINNELTSGHSICIMLPQTANWDDKIKLLQKRVDFKVVPIRIDRKILRKDTPIRKQLSELFKTPIHIHFGD